MRQINIDDRVYEQIEKEATRLHLDVDTYLSTILMREAAPARDAGREHDIPKEISGIGLFADLPDSFDAVMEEIMDERARPWRLNDDESIS